jgi:hypothetical protein
VSDTATDARSALTAAIGPTVRISADPIASGVCCDAGIVASDSGTVSFAWWRGPGGLSVCVRHDWGLETCDYHLSSVASRSANA